MYYFSMAETKNYSNIATEILEAELLIELGTIEAYKGRSIECSRVFWKAVENKFKILRELAVRQNKSAD